VPPATEQVFLASPTTGRQNPALAAPWLFTGEDNLRVVIINAKVGVVVQLDGRRIPAGGSSPEPFSQTFTPTADRLPNTFNFALGEGFLLNCSLVVVAGAPLVGQTYCMLQVIRGLTGATIVLGCLLGGSVTAMQHLAYPGSPIEASTAGEPFVRSIIGATPAAGAEISETVPVGARWELLSLNAFLLSTLGTARPELRHLTGATLLWQAIAPSGQGAGTTVNYNWLAGVQVIPAGGVAGGGTQMAPLPTSAILLAGEILTTSAVANAADQWSAPHYIVREWPEVA
jgi:hypothetical protein